MGGIRGILFSLQEDHDNLCAELEAARLQLDAVNLFKDEFGKQWPSDDDLQQRMAFKFDQCSHSFNDLVVLLTGTKVHCAPATTTTTPTSTPAASTATKSSSTSTKDGATSTTKSAAPASTTASAAAGRMELSPMWLGFGAAFAFVGM